MKKSVLTVVMSVIFVFGAVLSRPPESSWAERKKNIFIGSTQTSSSHYAYAVAATSAINKYVPEINASVVETGASVDNIKRLQKGEVDIGAIVAGNTQYEAWKGIGIWKNKQTPDLRILWVFTKTIQFNMAREDSGVRKFEDLNGKKFNPGMRGSAVEADVKQIFSILDIKPNYYIAGTADAVEALKDGRIVGYSKNGAGLQLDASTLDIMTATKIRLISMTSEEVKKVKAMIPYIPFLTIPSGTIKALPNHPEYTSWGYVVGAVAMKNFPDDLAYKAVKAIIKGRNMIIAAYPAHADVDVVRDTPKLATIPLHVGAYRAYKEMGVGIPELAIPPEAGK